MNKPITDKHREFCRWLLREDASPRSLLFNKLFGFTSKRIVSTNVYEVVTDIAHSTANKYNKKVSIVINEFMDYYETQITHEWNKRNE